MRRIWALWSAVFSLALAACQSSPSLHDDTLCTLRIIEVSEATRAHLRAPLEGEAGLPDGYMQFLRDLAAHNTKIRTHCGV